MRKINIDWSYSDEKTRRILNKYMRIQQQDELKFFLIFLIF